MKINNVFFVAMYWPVLIEPKKAKHISHLSLIRIYNLNLYNGWYLKNENE